MKGRRARGEELMGLGGAGGRGGRRRGAGGEKLGAQKNLRLWGMGWRRSYDEKEFIC